MVAPLPLNVMAFGLEVNGGSSGSIRYYHQDHLGSLAASSDAVGTLSEENGYYPFGTIRDTSVALPVNEAYLFAEKETDSETKLQYFEARFLAANLGRFTRVDPIVGEISAELRRTPQSLNSYGYTLGNPVNLRDPSGAKPPVAGTEEFYNSGQSTIGPPRAEPTTDEEYAARGYKMECAGGFACAWVRPEPTESFHRETSLEKGVKEVLKAVSLISLASGLGELVTGLEAATAFESAAALEGQASRIVPGGGLAAHENAGGHLLARHVGRTEADLAARLVSQPRIPAASTFVSRAEAEAAVSSVLDRNAAQLSAWQSAGSQGRLVLNGPFSGGSVLLRGASAARPGNGATIVLQGNGAGGWHVLTGYPTP